MGLEEKTFLGATQGVPGSKEGVVLKVVLADEADFGVGTVGDWIFTNPAFVHSLRC
jgi:hypothetical protein